MVLEQLAVGYRSNSLAQRHHETAVARQAGAKYQDSSLATLKDDYNNNNKAPGRAVKVAKPNP